MDSTNTSTWWALGIAVVLLVLFAVWWTASSSYTPGIPNTGTGTTTTSEYY